MELPRDVGGNSSFGSDQAVEARLLGVSRLQLAKTLPDPGFGIPIDASVRDSAPGN